MIFLQVLGDISTECKERAMWLYKCFVNFFAEQDKKWIYVITKMKERVQFYKNLAKSILQQKNKNVEHIEDLSTVLFANKVTKENWEDHKTVINSWLTWVNEKREQIYQLEAHNEIIQKELELWVTNFNEIKWDQNTREKLKWIDLKEMENNVTEELKHKNLNKIAKSLVLNSDIYLRLSGQQSYFYEQKKFYVNENRRWQKWANHKQARKKYYKDLLKEHKIIYQKEKDRHNIEVNFLRDKWSRSNEEVECQTEVDIFKFNKLVKNNDIILKHKRLTLNRWTDLVEKVTYGCSKVTPLSKQSLLNLIPDLYNSKYWDDLRREKENLPKVQFDEFILTFFTEKFKLKKIIQKHLEETISGICHHEKSDFRIFLFKRFLGIDTDKIGREALDIYLILWQNLPITYSKLYYDKDYLNYLMDTNYCFEILYNRWGFYNLFPEWKEWIILNSKAYEGTKTKPLQLSNEKKMEYYYWYRFSEKAVVFFNDLLLDSKNNIVEKNVNEIIANIQDSNLMFELDWEDCFNILKSNFNVDPDKKTVDLPSFLEFFVHKIYFKMPIVEYLDFVFRAVWILFQSIESKIEIAIIERGVKEGFMHFKDFEGVIMKLTKSNTELKWKLPSFFSDVCGGGSRDFISREELVSFVWNSKEILSILIMQNADKIKPKKQLWLEQDTSGI